MWYVEIPPYVVIQSVTVQGGLPEMPGEATYWITNNASNQIGGENGVLNLAGMPCHCSGGPACVIAIRYVMPANCITFSSISEFFILFWRKEPIIFKNHNYGLLNFFLLQSEYFHDHPYLFLCQEILSKEIFPLRSCVILFTSDRHVHPNV